MENTTEAFARKLGIVPQTVRARLCRFGHYFGAKPVKLPNGRLWWPDDAFERMAFGKGNDDEAGYTGAVTGEAGAA